MIKKIIVLISQKKLEILNESRRTKGALARKDAPHFDGDLYHAHKKLPSGFEVAWDTLGNRRHPNKFPADNKIPSAAKAEIAKMLGIATSKLEAYQGFDEIEGQEVYILTEKPLAVQALEKLDELKE